MAATPSGAARRTTGRSRPRASRAGLSPSLSLRVTPFKSRPGAPPAARVKFTPAEVAAALRISGGLVAIAARRLRSTPGLVRRYIQLHASVREVADEARTFLVDSAESKLRAAVQKGAPWAICFTLKCLGKDRGYVERQEHVGANGAPLPGGETVIVIAGESRDYVAKLREFRTALAARAALAIPATAGGNGGGDHDPK